MTLETPSKSVNELYTINGDSFIAIIMHHIPVPVVAVNINLWLSKTINQTPSDQSEVRVQQFCGVLTNNQMFLRVQKKCFFIPSHNKLFVHTTYKSYCIQMCRLIFYPQHEPTSCKENLPLWAEYNVICGTRSANASHFCSSEIEMVLDVFDLFHHVSNVFTPTREMRWQTALNLWEFVSINLETTAAAIVFHFLFLIA